MDVDADEPNRTVDLTVKYFACDDALAFCLRAEQDYKVHLMCDPNHEWSIRETPAESEVMDLPDGPVPMPKEGETI